MVKLNPLSANPTKWSNIIKQIVGNLPTNCFGVFDHFVRLALKNVRKMIKLLPRPLLHHRELPNHQNNKMQNVQTNFPTIKVSFP